MGRSNLQTACTELYVNIAVLDDRYYAVYERYDYLMALQPLVLHVLRVDTHCGIAHDGLWTCGSYHCIVALLILVEYLSLFTCKHYRVGVGVSHIVFQVIEL